MEAEGILNAGLITPAMGAEGDGRNLEIRICL